MAIRMGLNVQTPWNAGVEDYVRNCRPGIVMWVDKPTLATMQFVKSYGGINVVRRWFPDDQQWGQAMVDPGAAAQFCFNELYAQYSYAWPYVDYCVGFNEYWGSDKFATQDETGKRWVASVVAKFETDMMAQVHNAGKKYAYYSLPPGNCELSDWNYVCDAVGNIIGSPFPGDALCCHEYWRTQAGPLDRNAGNDRTAPYLMGRFEFYNPLPPTVIVGECGYDNYATPKWGWQHSYQFPNRDPYYANQFGDYCNLIDDVGARKNITILGACFFIVGRDPVWISEGNGKGFDFTGIYEIQQKMAAWPKQHTERTVTPPMPTQPVWWGRFADIAREAGLGNPVSEIVYDAFGNATQFGQNGQMVFDKKSDMGYYLPARYKRSGSAVTQDCPNPFPK
jgi:hypothetical protein